MRNIPNYPNDGPLRAVEHTFGWVFGDKAEVEPCSYRHVRRVRDEDMDLYAVEVADHFNLDEGYALDDTTFSWTRTNVEGTSLFFESYRVVTIPGSTDKAGFPYVRRHLAPA